MSVSLTLKGLTDLVKSLERMPDGLQQKASATVRQAAIETAADLQSKLPIGPGRKATKKRAAVAGGNLRKGVRVVQRDPLVGKSSVPPRMPGFMRKAPRRARAGAATVA